VQKKLERRGAVLEQGKVAQGIARDDIADGAHDNFLQRIAGWVSADPTAVRRPKAEPAALTIPPAEERSTGVKNRRTVPEGGDSCTYVGLPRSSRGRTHPQGPRRECCSRRACGRATETCLWRPQSGYACQYISSLTSTAEGHRTESTGERLGRRLADRGSHQRRCRVGSSGAFARRGRSY